MYDKLVEKVNNIDTSGFVLKIDYEADKSELEKKIPDTSVLVRKTNYNRKITEIENKIPNISGLPANVALTAIKSYLENKIPNISSLAKKKDYNTKLLKLKINLQIIVINNILLLQSLVSLHQKICCKIETTKCSDKDRFWW